MNAPIDAQSDHPLRLSPADWPRLANVRPGTPAWLDFADQLAEEVRGSVLNAADGERFLLDAYKAYARRYITGFRAA